MPSGKLASQSGHAFVESFAVAEAWRQKEYRADGLGTKICLVVPSLAQLLRWAERVRRAGLPHALIEDTGRNTTFGGVPTVSALGVGPLRPDEALLLRRLPLFP